MIVPTFLYVKRHQKTGKMYFGKTQKANIESYSGSGVYWLKHIKKHGKEFIENVWVSEAFTDEEDLIEFATFFSEEFDIVNSENWANLQEENGIDGAPKGVANSGPSGAQNGMYGRTGDKNPFYDKRHNPEQIQKWSETRLGELNPNFGGKAFTEETLKKLRKPKPNKENYKGTPGKITCIDKNGNAVQIDKDVYSNQKLISSNQSEWEYVNTNSKEAKRRRTK